MGRTKGYDRQTGGAHQVAWQDDAIILDRIRVGLKPWLECRSPLECLDVVRAYMAEAHPGEPPIGLRTMYDDRERAQSLTTRDLEMLRAEHVAELNHVIARGWEAFESTNPSSRAALLATISQTIERKAKVDGTLATALQIASIAVVESPKAQERAEVDMSDEAMARILAIAMDLREQRGGPLIDPTAEWVPPGSPPLLSGPKGQPAPEEDDGVYHYVERL